MPLLGWYAGKPPDCGGRRDFARPGRGNPLWSVVLAASLLFASPAAQTQTQTQSIVPRGENFIVATGATDTSGGRPGVTSDGVNFMVTWRVAGSTNINCARVSRDGVLLDTTPLVVGTGTHVPSVAFDGTNFLLVWTDASEVRAARVSPAGVLVDATPLAITSGGDVKDRPITVAFDGNNYMVSWRTNGDAIRGARISKAGAALDAPDGFPIGGGFYPWVAAGGGNFVVAWHAHGPSGLDVYAARIAADGTVLDPGGFLIADLPGDQDHVSIAFSGVNFLIVWHDWRNTDNFGNGQAYGARLAIDGRTVLDSPPFQISDMTLWQVPVEVAFDGIDYFVAWHASSPAKFRLTDAYGRRVSVAGTLPDERPIPIGTSYSHQWGPSLAADGDRLLVTLGDMRTGSVCGGGCLQAQLLERKTIVPMVTLVSGSPTGQVWSVEPAVGSDPLYAVTAVNGGGVYAVGEGPILERTVTGWQVAYVTNNRMFGLWAGGSGPQVRTVGWCWQTEHFDGQQWELGNCHGGGPSPDPFDIGLGIWGFGNDYFMTVGSEGSFQIAPTFPTIRGNTGTTVTLFAVWGTSPTNIYAVGEFGRIMHFDGASWTRVANVPTVQTLNAIWGNAPDNIYVAGDFGTILHFDGATWTQQATPTSAHLLGITGSGANRLYAVGSRGVILRYDGSQWNLESSGTSSWLFAVTSANNMVWAVGEAGLILKKDLPGASTASVALASSLNPALTGAGITLTASLSGAAGAVTGNVAFRNGAGAIGGCESVAIASDVAICTTNSLPAGSHALTAAYLGSTVYADRVSAVLVQVVANTPGAPQIIGAIAGDGEASLRFSAPANNGGLPVTSYTATCNPGPVVVTGSGSPLTVAPLANNVMHVCFIAASNAVGTGAASTTVNVTPSAIAPLTLVRASSRKQHGAAGYFDLPIDITAPPAGAVTVEPRGATAGHLLVLQFNVPITDSSIDAQVTPTGAASALATGKIVQLILTAVSDRQRITVSLNNLNGSAGSIALSLGFLLGDVNQSRAINAADISVVKARAGQTLTDANFLYDVNASGTIDARDLSVLKARAGQELP